jgi:hypothetical protein
MNPGDIIDRRFTVARFAGSGGMSLMYRAEDVDTREPVALKVLHGSLGERWRSRRRGTATLSEPARRSVAATQVAWLESLQMKNTVSLRGDRAVAVDVPRRRCDAGFMGDGVVGPSDE